MIVITGLGRSGTSLLAKFFEMMGFKLGPVEYRESTRSGMELREGCLINEHLYKKKLALGHGIRDYHDKDESIKKVFQDVDVFKDPRFTWHPSLIRKWYGLVPDMKLIICHRNFMDIIVSRRKANKNVEYDFLDPKREENLDEFKKDFADFITMVMELEIPHSVIMFPNFVNHYYKIYYTCRDLGIMFSRERGAKVWRNLMDLSLIDNGR